jgi:hypothetical protein
VVAQSTSILGALSGRPEEAEYSAAEVLANGCPVQIRALRPEDRDLLIAAVARTSAQSLYRRFFGVRRNFTDKEIAFFLNVDFVNHVALVALLDADSDEAGHAFRYEAGHLFRSEAGRGSDLMSATARRRCGSWE